MIMEDDYPALPQHTGGIDDDDTRDGVLETVPLPLDSWETLTIACVVPLIPCKAEPDDA